MNPDQSILQRLNGFQMGVLVVAAVGAVISAIGAFSDLDRFFQMYLVGVVLWTEVAVGCLGLVMLNNLVGARWSYALQRIAEAGARTLPLTAIFFIPLFFRLGAVYIWVEDTSVISSAGQAFLLQPSFFIVRTVVYYAIWTALAYTLTGWSYQRDQNGDSAIEDKSRAWSAVGAVIYVLTTTLASVDWLMSLDPTWFSSSYGWLTLSRAVLSSMAFFILALAFFWNSKPMSGFLKEQDIVDIGMLLLTTVLVWLYMQVIQFLIVWAGNVSYFASWYTTRLDSSWINVTNIIVIVHAVILLILLVPGTKRQRRLLVVLSAVLLLMRAVELFWVVAPTYSPEFTFQIGDIGPVIALLGLWLAYWIRLMQPQRLLPVHHPSLEHASSHESAKSVS